MPEIEFVLSNYGDHGWGVDSPDIPGLVAGKQTLDQITPEYLTSLCEVAGVSIGEGYEVLIEEVVVADEGVISVLARQSLLASLGARAAQVTILDMVRDDPDYRASLPTDHLGDRHIVMCLPSDTVGRVTHTLPEGAPFVAAIAQESAVAFVTMIPSLAAEPSSSGGGRAEVVARVMTFAEVLARRDAIAGAPRRDMQFA